MKRALFVVAAALAGLASIAVSARGGGERVSYNFTPAIRGLDSPVHVSAPRSEPNNLYIVEQRGRIRDRKSVV